MSALVLINLLNLLQRKLYEPCSEKTGLRGF